MPSRIIQAQINSSESLSLVSMEAELTFDRLLTYVNKKTGRGDGRLTMLKAGLFPLRDEATEGMIFLWIDQLCAVNCVRLGCEEGRQYIELTNWGRYSSKPRAKRAEPLLPIPPWATAVSKKLISCLGPVPGARIPERAESRWAREIELMPAEIPELEVLLGEGGESAVQERLEVAVEWVTGPDCMTSVDPQVRRYAPQVRSGRSLRTKWGQITAAAVRCGPRKLTREEIAREVARV